MNEFAADVPRAVILIFDVDDFDEESIAFEIDGEVGAGPERKAEDEADAGVRQISERGAPSQRVLRVGGAGDGVDEAFAAFGQPPLRRRPRRKRMNEQRRGFRDHLQAPVVRVESREQRKSTTFTLHSSKG